MRDEHQLRVYEMMLRKIHAPKREHITGDWVKWYNELVHVFKHNQQDATLHNDIYHYKCSTCFRRFLCPSSGAENCIHSIGDLSSFYCFLKLDMKHVEHL